MGCDIHGFVEVKKTVNGAEKWVCADYFKKKEYYDPEDSSDPEYVVVDAFGSRNYAAFSQLCGVRSFADENPKVSEPRGVPEDSNQAIKQQVEQWDGDGHSHSFVTLRDVIDFRKGLEQTKICGMISPDMAEKLDESGEEPTMWCQATRDESWVYREWTVFIDPLEELESVLRQRAKEFLWAFNEESQNEASEKIRYVFFFDN
jgi:hypothetical protein